MPVPQPSQLENSKGTTVFANLPQSFDWRRESKVTLIKNQGKCLSGLKLTYLRVSSKSIFCLGLEFSPKFYFVVIIIILKNSGKKLSTFLNLFPIAAFECLKSQYLTSHNISGNKLKYNYQDGMFY